MDLGIRQAVLEDYESLCVLMSEGDAFHAQNLPDRFVVPGSAENARTKEYVAGLLSDPNTSLLVGERNGELVGLIITILHDTPPIPILVQRRYAVVDLVVVRSDQRGSGIGSALMAQGENWARSMGASEVELNVFFFNERAIRFYENLGYIGSSQRMVKKI